MYTTCDWLERAGLRHFTKQRICNNDWETLYAAVAHLVDVKFILENIAEELQPVPI